MSNAELDVELDLSKALEGLKKLGSEATTLAATIEQALAKNATKSIDELQEHAENGANRITQFFGNMGKRIREDLKTAFDATGVLAGAKFAQHLGDGVKQVFEMERAFDRLNTRLGFSTKKLDDFKKAVGRNVSSTGQKLEDILPGVETIAAKGGLKDAGQLADVSKILGEVRGTTGENVEGLSADVVEILKNQGQVITGKSIKDTIDALQGARVNGAFKTTGDAAKAVGDLAPFARQFHLGNRELAGLAATASRGGDRGTDILHQLLERASKPGQQGALNSILGQNVFKNGKLDASALGKVDMNKFGQYSQQVLEEATGITGASGADLARFIGSFKDNMSTFDSVINGANETADQFDKASDNWATKIDKFKENLKEAGREIGGSFSEAANQLMKGNLYGVHENVNKGLMNAWENKGTIAAGLATTAGMGMLAGGGIKSLMGKLPGGGLAAGLVGEQLAEATGAQKVYVVNAAEIGSAFGGGPAAAAGGLMGKLGTGVAAAGAGAIGYEVGDYLYKNTMVGKGADSIADAVSSLFGEKDTEKKAMDMQDKKNYADFMQRNPQAQLSFDQYEQAVANGTLKAMKSKQPAIYTNPSQVKGRN